MRNSLALLMTFMLCSFWGISAQEKYPSFAFDGILKNKFEVAPQTGKYRFDVRNSRLGLKGKIIPGVDYRAQLELSNEGKFQVLDLSGTLKPITGLSFTFGQTSIPLFNSYTTNPGTMMFANRTFLAKYYAGTRDIGLLTTYEFAAGKLPVALDLGIFNGNVINDPRWTDRFSYSARLSLGAMKGLRSTFKVYDYLLDEKAHYFIYGADLRYEAADWKIESEVMQRNDKIAHKDLLSAYLQGAYSFKLKNEKGIFQSIIPAARYDMMDEYNNGGKMDVSRFTLGLGLGIGKKAFASMLRLDYEWYFVKNPLSLLQKYEEMDKDKFTIELVYVF